MKSLKMNGEDGNVVSGVDAVNNDNDGCSEIPKMAKQETKRFLCFVLLGISLEPSLSLLTASTPLTTLPSSPFIFNDFIFFCGGPPKSEFSLFETLT
jgi:hypothetical protein